MKYIPFCKVKRYFLIELCTCRNMVIYHKEMKLFFAFFFVYCTEKHTTRVNAHHCSWRKICDCDKCLTNKFFRLVICVNTA